jgi:hypothetical protein
LINERSLNIRKAEPNRYEIYDDYAEIVIDSPKYGIFKAKIDLEDLERCRQYRWGARKANKQNYD